MESVLVENISKAFKDRIVLNNISLKINKGEIVGIIGPSGAGKTTLIKSIIGMEKAEEGNIKIFGEEIPNRKVLQRIGYMAQSDALYLDISARDNLLFFANIFKMEKSEIEKRVKYLLDLVDLSEFSNSKVKNFSGGMKRRLSLIIALVQDPDLLILDEPTVGIDPELRLSIWKEIKNLKEAGKSIIITTHDMTEALKCDRLLLLRDGNIIANGTAEELMKKFNVDSIEEAFLLAGRKK